MIKTDVLFNQRWLIVKKSIISKIVSITFITLLVVGLACMPFIPNLYDAFKAKSVVSFMEQSSLYKFVFFSCYIVSLGVLYKLNQLFSFVYKGTPFTKEMESTLKIIAILFMTLSVIVVIKSIFIPTILSFAVAIVCFVTSLCFYVLAEIIKAAIIYKNEIDYTV